MKKIAPLFIVFLFSFIFSDAQLRSPEQFLGYKIGDRYTPHWRIVEYFRHVTANAPTMVKTEQYGQTYEGRPLIVSFISSPSNISNLEKIRTNNLSLAQMTGTSGLGATLSRPDT